MQPILLWSLWQALLAPFAPAFSDGGFRRFVEWVTGLALNVEEHTITQSLIALEPDRRLEGSGDLRRDRPLEPGTASTWALADLLEDAPGRLWHGYHVWAGDDTKVHRTSTDVWGTCTFHEYTARCPNRASTVRAHNWVVLGDLLHNPERPAWFLPVTGRLYFRKSPTADRTRSRKSSTPRANCRSTCCGNRWRSCPALHLAVFDGGFGVASVVRPLVSPERGRATHRLRHAAAARRAAVRRAAAEPAAGAAWSDAQVGPAAGRRPGKAAAGRARGSRGRRSCTGGCGRCVEGSGLPVAGVGVGSTGQGGGSRSRGLPQAFHLVSSATGTDRPADRGVVLCSVPAGGRLPRPEATAGLGGVPGLDEEAGAADIVGADGDHEFAALVAV